ncbi:MAG TPA: chromate efflux transporter [Polyangiaceae bacterium]|nr:chromate efflux transporter [Polyangiaceae bacterium]
MPSKSTESTLSPSGPGNPLLAQQVDPPTFSAALWVWARIGFLGFGGPAGQIALMHKELVETRRWIDEHRFLHALNYCMLLPGPEAQQLAIYIGWLLHRTLGGVAAGLLFVLPGSAAMLAISIAYVRLRHLPSVEALFFGLKAAVLAIVVEAVLRIGRRALRSRSMMLIFVLAFLALFLFGISFPYVIAGAGLFGFMGSQLRPDWFPLPAQRPATAGQTAVDSALGGPASSHIEPNLRRAVRVLVVCGALWVAPLWAIFWLWGPSSVFFKQGVFFSQTAVITFGGAYAVLSYIAEQAVEKYGWLVPGEMLDGLGLAETTPGPLIMVVQFVSFLGAYRHPGGLPPLWAGCLGAAVTVWVTFVPCFLWIFLGAPYIEALRNHRALNAALSTITAAVVGVILNLSVWFFVHVVFRDVSLVNWGPLHLLTPSPKSVDWAAALLASAALLAMLRFKLGLPKTLLMSALLGLGWRWVAVTFLALGAAGCGSSDPAPEAQTLVPLAQLADFMPLDGHQDPLEPHRPSTVDCSDLVGWYIEDDALEVNTGECNYLAAGAPADVAVSQGTVINTTISYYDLTSEQPASAHIALLINDELLWEQTISVPAPARVMELSVPAPVDIKRGDLVSFHLHNHGQNSYKLQALRVPADAALQQ